MDERQIFAMQVCIFGLIALIAYLPLTIYKNWKHRKEGKSFTIKYGLLIMVPIGSIPFVFTDLMPWYTKVITIPLIFVYPALYIIGLRRSRDTIRRLFGLPPVDVAGQIIKDENSETYMSERGHR